MPIKQDLERHGPGSERPDTPDPDEAPETPTDEPKPTPVQDPPTEPGRAPYVVVRRGQGGGPSTESRAMNEAGKSRSVGAGMTNERKERRGFASMSPEKQREIASKGGRAAHQKGTAHEWTSEEARSAGRKGGQISRGGRGRLVEAPAPEPTQVAGTGAAATGDLGGQ